MLMLKGWVGGNVGHMDSYREFVFTLGEKALALSWATLWDERGEKPVLVQKTYNNPQVRVLYNWKTRAKAKQQKKAA